MKDKLPPLPERMRDLPIQKGYPVPWFVLFIDGHYDFRVINGEKVPLAINNKLCWICGQKLGSTMVFSIGPMCAVNQINSEPPSHIGCALYAVKACPFLTQQEVKRNTKNLPEGTQGAAGVHIERQPGVIALWCTRSYKTFDAEGGSGLLFEMGPAEQVTWWREGRRATRQEILEAIESGMPLLEDLASHSTMELQILKEKKQKALKLIPPDDTERRPIFGSAAKR